MRLVIEREGGFDVIENSDDIKRIEPQNDGVRVTFMDSTDEFYPVADHAAACRLSAAIAVRCGVLVEPLAVQEEPEADGLEDAAADDAMGAAMAALVRKNTTSRRAVTASQWVTGEPPKDGRLYVVRDRGGVRIVAWCGVSGGWWAGESGLLVATEIREHMLAPISDAPAVSVDGASEWTQGEPPKDGRWYVVALHREGNGYGMPPSLAAWYGGRWLRCDAEPETAVAWHLPTPVPGVPS